MTMRRWADETVAEATGRHRRTDPVLAGGGGPAGNARLTAWTGLVLLVLFVVEMATLLDLGPLIGWHIAVGALLVPPALVKTATTGWRIVGYYTNRAPYRTAGPPPMPLRALGPLVVLFTLAVLGSGIALVAIGPGGDRSAFGSVLGRSLDALTIHKVTFVLWAVVTGLHTLARLVPALRTVTGAGPAGERVPGAVARTSVLLVTLVAAGVVAAVLLGMSDSWLTNGLRDVGHHRVSDHAVSSRPAGGGAT